MHDIAFLSPERPLSTKKWEEITINYKQGRWIFSKKKMQFKHTYSISTGYTHSSRSSDQILELGIFPECHPPLLLFLSVGKISKGPTTLIL